MRKLLWGIIVLSVAAIIISVVAAVGFKKSENAVTDEVQTEEFDVDAQKNEESEQNGGVLDGKIICIDPGHGKTSRSEKEPIYPGASEKKATNVSGTSGKTMSEEALNLLAGVELRDALTGMGALVYMTREGHECDMSNVERAEFANEKNADLVIRLHADGSESASTSGVSMLLPDPKRSNGEYLTAEVVEKSRIAGELILSEVISRTDAKNRGTVTRPDMTGFNWSKVPVVLLEMGFMTNAEEEARLVDSEYRAKIIDGICAGCEKYFSEN